MPNEITIEIKATADGLRGQVRAKVEEAAAGQEIKVPIDVDRDSTARAGRTAASDILSSMSGLFSGSQGIGTGASASIMAALTSPVGMAAAIPVIGGLVSGVEALAGVLPIAGAGFVAAATAGATFMVGMSGITEAVKAYTTANDAGIGKTAQLASQHISSVNAIINANKAVSDSRQAVLDTARNVDNSIISGREAVDAAIQAQATAEYNADQSIEQATQAVQRAEDNLTSTKHAALLAEQNLTSARLAASRALEDAPNKVRDAQLASEQAINDLQRAQSAVLVAHQQQQATLHLTAQGLISVPAAVMAAPDTQGLNIAMEQAQQRVVETGLAYQRAQEDATTMTAAGVDGARQVVTAQDQLNSAVRAQEAAQRAVTEAVEAAARAQVTATQSVAQAEQRVGDARRALAQAEINGDEQIRRSKEAVDAALRAQQQTLASVAASAEGAAGSLSIYNDMLARLSPNGADAVRAIVGLHDSWQALTRDVQQHLFAGVGDEIRQVGAVVLPIVQTGLDRMGDALNGIIHAVGEWLSSKDATRDMGIIFDNVAAAVRNVTPAVHSVFQIVTDLLTVAATFLPGLAEGFARSAQTAADFIRHARDTGQLREWMQSGINVIHDLYLIARDVLGIFNNLTGKRGFSSSLFDDIAVLIHDMRILSDWIAPVIQGLNWLSNWRLPGWGILGAGNILGHASGGISGGGFAMVGEQGPELVRLPSGSQVLPSGESRQMMASGGGSQDIRVILEVQTSGLPVEDFVGEMVQRFVRVRPGNANAVLSQ